MILFVCAKLNEIYASQLLQDMAARPIPRETVVDDDKERIDICRRPHGVVDGSRYRLDQSTHGIDPPGPIWRRQMVGYRRDLGTLGFRGVFAKKGDQSVKGMMESRIHLQWARTHSFFPKGTKGHDDEIMRFFADEMNTALLGKTNA